VKAIVQIFTTVVLTFILGPEGALASLALSATQIAVTAAAAAAVIVTGLSGGNLGQMLKAGLIAGATAFAFFEVGDLTPGAAHAMGSSQFDPAAYVENVAGHALVGCGSSVASGGSCQSGALSAAVTAGAGPLINGQNQVASLVANSVLGGVASVAGGGKFANGAITGAFGYMFNQAAHSGNSPNDRHQMGVEAAMQDYLDRGYSVIQQTPVAVDVPGFATPRYYDFIVQDPAGNNIGVEVKTTLYDTIRLNGDQVAKDVVVMQSTGFARTLDLAITGVGYITYCWACSGVDFRSAALYSTLKAANIPFTHGGRPGEIRP
jgi:hypothetical protein